MLTVLQPAKTPKTTTKLKLTNPKTPTVDTLSKKKTPKSKASAKKFPAKVNDSDEDMAESPKVEEKPPSVAELKDKKEKESKLITAYRLLLLLMLVQYDTIVINSRRGFSLATLYQETRRSR